MQDTSCSQNQRRIFHNHFHQQNMRYICTLKDQTTSVDNGRKPLIVIHVLEEPTNHDCKNEDGSLEIG